MGIGLGFQLIVVKLVRMNSQLCQPAESGEGFVAQAGQAVVAETPGGEVGGLVD